MKPYTEKNVQTVLAVTLISIMHVWGGYINNSITYFKHHRKHYTQDIKEYGNVISVVPTQQGGYFVTCEKSVFTTKDQYIDIPLNMDCKMIFRKDGKKLAEFYNGQSVWCH